MPVNSIEERLRHIAEAKRRTQSEIPWICDTMDNAFKSAFGNAPNGEFVIDPEGRIVRKRFWSNPDTLRQDLAELVGDVDQPTRVNDLPARFRVEPRPVASGVIPRLELPGGLMPIKTEPLADGEQPYFVKLRAEAQEDLLGEGKGKLYLGFYLDPIYKVHWNNEVARLKFEIAAAEGTIVEPSQGTAPKVNVAADVDPRQFLLDVSSIDKGAELELTVHYMACDDAATFCVPVTQKYRLQLERNRNGGTRPGIFMNRMFANVRNFDKNKDGKITRDELPKGRVTLFMGHMDFNFDDVIDEQELTSFLRMFGNGNGLSSDRNDGESAETEEDSAAASNGN